MHVILARHCQTEWNAKRLIQGYADIPLDATGVELAHRLGGRLADVDKRPIALILSSDLLRARQTSEIVRRYVPVPIVHDARLREANFGSLEGLTYEQFDAQCGAKNLREHPNVLEWDFAPFGGDAAVTAIARARAAIESVSLPTADAELLVLSHGRLLRTIYYAQSGVNQHFDNGAHLAVRYVSTGP